MKLRLGAALLAAMTTATVLAPAPSSHAGVETTPPAVGSCHALTLEEALAASDPDPAVRCTERHTSVTTRIVRFRNAPNWGNTDRLLARIETPCSQSQLALFGGHAKPLQMSAYFGLFFIPTKAQRDAGAKWVRCDTALISGRSLRALPTDGDPELGRLPLPDRLARCRVGKAGGYAVTTCDRKHAFRATHAVKYPSRTYPGTRRMSRWTLRKCRAKLGGAAFYYEPAERAEWRAGMRFSVCLRKTRG